MTPKLFCSLLGVLPCIASSGFVKPQSRSLYDWLAVQYVQILNIFSYSSPTENNLVKGWHKFWSGRTGVIAVVGYCFLLIITTPSNRARVKGWARHVAKRYLSITIREEIRDTLAEGVAQVVDRRVMSMGCNFILFFILNWLEIVSGTQSATSSYSLIYSVCFMFFCFACVSLCVLMISLSAEIPVLRSRASSSRLTCALVVLSCGAWAVDHLQSDVVYSETWFWNYLTVILSYPLLSFAYGFLTNWIWIFLAEYLIEQLHEWLPDLHANKLLSEILDALILYTANVFCVCISMPVADSLSPFLAKEAQFSSSWFLLPIFFSLLGYLWCVRVFSSLYAATLPLSVDLHALEITHITIESIDSLLDPRVATGHNTWAKFLRLWNKASSLFSTMEAKVRIKVDMESREQGNTNLTWSCECQLHHILIPGIQLASLSVPVFGPRAFGARDKTPCQLEVVLTLHPQRWFELAKRKLQLMQSAGTDSEFLNGFTVQIQTNSNSSGLALTLDYKSLNPTTMRLKDFCVGVFQEAENPTAVLIRSSTEPPSNRSSSSRSDSSSSSSSSSNDSSGSGSNSCTQRRGSIRSPTKQGKERRDLDATIAQLQEKHAEALERCRRIVSCLRSLDQNKSVSEYEAVMQTGLELWHSLEMQDAAEARKSLHAVLQLCMGLCNNSIKSLIEDKGAE